MKPVSRIVMVMALVVSFEAAAARLAGVQVDDTTKVGEAAIKLNGMAVRKKAIFDVYVGALYLPEKTNDPQKVVSDDVAKALVMSFVRDVEREKLVEAYREGFANNAPELAKANKADIDRFIKLIPDVKEGQKIVFTYEPGKGSTVQVPGKSEHFEGKAFADAYLLVYVGKIPPSSDLKRGLLGK